MVSAVAGSPVRAVLLGPPVSAELVGADDGVLEGAELGAADGGPEVGSGHRPQVAGQPSHA